MEEIKYIEPAALHDEMLRLRNEKQMDFLESLTGMDWGVADEGDAPNVTRGLGVVYHLESTVTGERIAIKTSTNNRETPEIPSVSDIWKVPTSTSVKFSTITALYSSDIPTCDVFICVMTGYTIRCVKITTRERQSATYGQ